MSNTISDFQLFCACGVSYNINTSTQNGSDLPQDIYYTSSQFQSSPQIFQGLTFPETAACLIGQSTPSGQTTPAVIIAFRGTEYTSVSDWATDLLAEPFTPSNFPDGGLVHTGFYYSTMELIPQIQTALTNLALPADTPIYITGHSKGGAMAFLAAYILCLAGSIKVADLRVTTFGSPAPGDNNFQTAFQKLIPQATTNYVNNLDIVPFLPPAGLVGMYIEYKENYNAVIDAMLNDFITWNFTPCNSIVQYISATTPTTPTSETASSFFNYLSKKSDGYLDMLAIYGVVQNAMQAGSISDLKPILDAHSHAQGGGYWNALAS